MQLLSVSFALILLGPTENKMPNDAQHDNRQVSTKCLNVPLRSDENMRPIGCSSEGTYLAEMRAVHPNRDWVVVDVGMNKGYVLGTMLMALGYRDRLNMAIFREVERFTNKSIVTSPTCGTCGNCKERRATEGDDSPVKSISLIGFDINRPNVEFATHFFSNFSAAADRDPADVDIKDSVASGLLKVDVRLTGVSSAVAEKDMNVCRYPFGYTLGKIDSKACTAFDQVKISTLDAELKQVPRVDFLVVDAEGHDYHVMRGASSMLAAGRIRMVQVELHGHDVTFHAFVEMMERWQYTCFLIVEGGLRDLVEVSGPCWSEVFNVRGWMNALCVHTGESRLLARLRRRQNALKGGTLSPRAR